MSATKIRVFYDPETRAPLRIVVPDRDDAQLEFHQPCAGEAFIDIQHRGTPYSIEAPPNEREIRAILQALP